MSANTPSVSANRGAGFSGEARRVGERWRRTKMSTPVQQGLFIGVVTDDSDPHMMGRVRVYIPNFSAVAARTARSPSQDENESSLTFMPIFPFAGSSDYSSNQDGYSQSYGMWYHPRVGDQVAVMFADSAVADGYYIGCVPKYFQNYQLPGTPIAPSDGEDFELPGSELPYGTQPGSRRVGYTLSSNLKASGLHKDQIRGGSTSGAQRESPSRVIGWKSPGDPASGAIGHQFVMDDLPANQGVRIRTSSGNQVLFSDAGAYIYLSTAKGGSWIQMGDDGNVDIYAQGSISMHAEKDINFTADRDINMNVGRDMNFSAGDDVTMAVGSNYDLAVLGDKHVTVGGKQDWVSGAGSDHEVSGEYGVTSSRAVSFKAGTTANVTASGDIFIYSETGDAHVQELPGDLPGEAAHATVVNTIQIPGGPTTDQVTSGDSGSDAQYVSGKDGNIRVPQHEPWDPNGGVQYISKPAFRQSALYNVNTHPAQPVGSARTVYYPLAEEDSASPRSGNNRIAGGPPLVKVDWIVVHCSATKPQANTTGTDVAGYHTAKGWKGMGYHIFIKRDGGIDVGRPLNVQGNHVDGYNENSIGVCMAGGLDPVRTYGPNKPLPWPDFTDKEMAALRQQVDMLKAKFPDAKVVGHRDLDKTKSCPCFDVPYWNTTGQIRVQTGMPEGNGQIVQPTTMQYPLPAGNMSPEDAARYLVIKGGFTEEQASGLIGNFMWESSGLNPRAVGDSGQARGIAQWHPDRYAGLLELSQQSGKDPNTVEAQLDWVIEELNTTEASAGDRIRNATSAAQAALICMTYYERPLPESRGGQPHAGDRQRYAISVFNSLA